MVVDDTNRPQLDNSPWPWVVNKTYPTPSEKQCSAVKTEEVGRAKRRLHWCMHSAVFLLTATYQTCRI